MNTILAQGILSGGLKFVSALITVLNEVAPTLSTLGPDVANLITDFNKLLSDVEGKGSTLLTNIEAAIKAGAPQPGA